MARHSTELFTRRHYEWLAAFARAELPLGDRVALCNALARDNVNFNRARFESASGIAEYLAGVAAVKSSSDGNLAHTAAYYRKREREAARIRRVGYP